MAAFTRPGISTGLLFVGMSLIGVAAVPTALAANTHRGVAAATKSVQAKEVNN